MKKRILLMLISCICLTAFTGCDTAKNVATTKSDFYFDTVITITLYGRNADTYIEKCFDMCCQYESYFSNTLEDSDISKINSSPFTPVEVSDATIELLNESLRYGEMSDDQFSVSVGYLSELWNYNSDNPEVPSQEKIDKALVGISNECIEINQNTVTLLSDKVKLDLGGIAKGYIADKLKEYLLSENINSGVINLGGNVLCVGPKPDSKDGNYNIGLQKPFDENGTMIAVVKVKDKSVVTSGIYQRYFTDDEGNIYHHILDLETGYPKDNDLNAVTIVSDSSTAGDALSTITYLKGLNEGIEFIESLDGVEAVFMDKNNNVYMTSGIGKNISVEILE